MSEESVPIKVFLSYEEIEDILGRDVVRRVERGMEEARAAAAAAYSDGGPAALEMLLLFHLVTVVTGFPGLLDPVCRAERAGTLLKYFVMDVMTARTDLPSSIDLPPAPPRVLS
jgi:hypothetical protein